MEQDGLEYLARYLANKFIDKYPYLDHTYKLKDMDVHNHTVSSWVQSLSFGGLIKPSEYWTHQVKKMDKYFNKFNQNKFMDGKGTVRKTTKYINKKLGIISLNLVDICLPKNIYQNKIFKYN